MNINTIYPSGVSLIAPIGAVQLQLVLTLAIEGGDALSVQQVDGFNPGWDAANRKAQGV